MSDDHTLGIHGALQHVVADLNMPKSSVLVHHVVGEDGCATTNVSQEQLRKALGVSHINLHNITGVQIKTQNQSSGPVACTIRSGNGEPLPLTDRMTAMNEGSMQAANQIVMPNTTHETGVMVLKELSTDKNKHKPYTGLTDEEKMRNKLNAAYYAHEGDSPSETHLFLHTVKAEHDGKSRVAIPIKAVIGPEDGGLTAVASRCIVHQKKAPKLLASDATIIKMPHRATGEMCDHLLASTRSVELMAETVRKNTEVNQTFGQGLSITTHSMNEHCEPGDHVIHEVTFHREPSTDSDKVCYQRDLMPDAVAASTATPAVAGGSAHEGAWHQAMFGKKNAGGASIDAEHGVGALGDGLATNEDGPEEPE
jgi:hypothetical protein